MLVRCSRLVMMDTLTAVRSHFQVDGRHSADLARVVPSRR